MLISIEEAAALAAENAVLLPEQWAGLQEAVGHVLTRDVRAPADQPPFDRSPLDGYAVRGADTEQASRETPAVLRVVDKLYAGQVPRTGLRPGEAVRLMTGCMIPQGADSVVRQEDTDCGAETVRVFKPVRSGGNYCRRGEEYRAGSKLLPAGLKLDAAAIAVAAGAGMTELPVRRRARAAVISTGDELCRPGEPLTAGKIYDSNAAYLLARLRQFGVETVGDFSAGDDCSALVPVLRRCGEADLILTTGGVSVGDRDLLEAAVRAFGAEVIFHGIAVKPGMPTLLARRGAAVILGLSGNPFAAAVPFELLVRPLLAKMTRDAALLPRYGWVTAANDFAKASPSRRFLRAFSDGWTVSMPTGQSNGQMRSMVGCNCLVDVPAGAGEIKRGDRVSVIWL